MALLFVTVNGNLGSAAAGAKGYWTPTGWLVDAPDMRVIPPAPLPPFTIAPDGSFTSGPLLANDSPGPQPTGTAWTLTINGIDDVAPLTQTYTILHANGATQDLSALAVAVPSPQFTTYLLAANNLADLPSPSAARTALQLGSAALQPASAFDTAGAASAAQAAAIAASLPTMAVTAVSASGALTVNKVTQVTAASNLTMTLPTPVAGALIVVEREAASATASTVTISGSIRGSANTITLLLPDESEMFLGTASTWDPVAGHKTLGSLDARYANVFSPLAFGAKGNGTTDDTAAVLACASAAAAARGVMDLGTFTYKTSSPIPVSSFFHLKGAGYGGGTITNSVSDLFTMTGSVFSVTIESCTLTAAGSGTGGGHVFNASASPAMSQWKLLGVTASQSSTSHCIWFQFGGGWIDCLVDQGCNFSCSGSATISPWTVWNAPGAWNSVKFSRMRCTANGAAVPFFSIDAGHGAHTDTSVGMTAASTTVTDASAVAADLGLLVNSANFPGGTSLITAVNPGTGYTVATPATASLSGQTCLIGTPGFDEDIIFEHITWEVCTGGAIWMTACVDVLISMCAHWDTTATSDIYHFSQSATGYPCRSIIVRGGRCGAVGGGASNFFADSNCTNILIDSFGEWGTPPVISSPTTQTTIINPTVTGATVPPVAATPNQVHSAGKPWFDVDAFGADPTGASDSTAAFMAAVNAATGGTVVTSGNFATDVTTGRTARGIVHMSPGTYKITADINIVSTLGFHLAGAGPEATVIVASGTGFTNAVININGSYHGIYEGFTLKGDGTDQESNGIILQWNSALASRSTTQNMFRDLNVRNLNFVNGINLGFNTGTPQTDGTTFSNVVVAGGQAANSWSTSGNWQKAIILGNGNQGNNYDHVLLNTSWSNCYYGLYCNASCFELTGSQPGSNAVDFFLAPAGYIGIMGVQSQNSGQLIAATGGSGVNKVAVRDVYVQTVFLVSTGQWVSVTGGAASWLFENVAVNTLSSGGAGGLGVPLMSFSGSGAKENITLVNVSQMAPPSTGVVVTSGGSVICIGYIQLNSSSQVGTEFPFWCLNARALYSQGLAAALPSATANGEGFYYATDTGALFHSNGSAWTTLSAGGSGASTAAAAAAGQSGGMSTTGYAGASVNVMVAAVTAPTSATWTGGAAYGQLVFCNPAATVNGFVTIYPWLGSGTLAGTFVGLYNSAGTQLGVTADLSAQATAGRGLRVAVPGFTTTPSDGRVYVLYTNATGAAGGPYLVAPSVPRTFGQVTPVSTVTPMGFVFASGGMPASLSFTNGIPSGASAGSPLFFSCLLD